MKRFALIIGLLIVQVTFSQTIKQVGEFTTLAVFDKISVNLIPSDEYKIELFGEGHGDVNFVNKNGVLKIKMNLKNSLQGDGVKANVYYKKLDEIIADEGAVVSSNAVIKETSLKLNAKNGGRVNLNVDVERLSVKGNTGGISIINGNANFQDILSNTGAQIKHKNLKTKQTVVTVNAGGEADVNASEFVEAKTRAGGNIYIYGNPKDIKEKTIAGGKIEKVTDK